MPAPGVPDEEARLAPLAVNDLDEITAFIRESSEQNADAFERCSLGTFEESMAEDLGFRRAFSG